jgi:hypothetical protein
MLGLIDLEVASVDHPTVRSQTQRTPPRKMDDADSQIRAVCSDYECFVCCGCYERSAVVPCHVGTKAVAPGWR